MAEQTKPTAAAGSEVGAPPAAPAAKGWDRNQMAARAARELHSAEDAQALKAKLESAKVKLAVKAGLGGRLFGSVKTADVAAAVADAGLGDLDKRKIEIPTPIKSVGDHEATVKLRDDVTATITLQVVAAK